MVLAFAAGAVAGGAFVYWYASTHPGEIAGEKIGAALFGEGSTGASIIAGLGHTIDQARN
jgi:hypothetical protein